MEDKALAETSRPTAGPGTVLWPAFPGWDQGAPISHVWGWVRGPRHSHASQGGHLGAGPTHHMSPSWMVLSLGAPACP